MQGLTQNSRSSPFSFLTRTKIETHASLHMRITHRDKKKLLLKLTMDWQSSIRNHKQNVQVHRDSLLRGSWITLLEEPKLLRYCGMLLKSWLLDKRRDFWSWSWYWWWSNIWDAGKVAATGSCCIWMQSISAWATASCICRFETWFCKKDIAPTHP